MSHCHDNNVPSVLWCCWLGGRKGIRPVKTKWWGACVVICLERGADLHTAQLMPLPLTVSCFSKIQIGCTFLVPAHLGSPGQRAIKRVVMITICHTLLLTSILVIISIPSPPSVFHFTLKTFLFCKSFPPQPSFFLQDWLCGFPGLFADTSGHIRFFTF